MEKVGKVPSALTPYRVLDLVDESGDFCTKVLAALGADVIKIEPPGGHPTRRIGPFYHNEVDPEKSLHWLNYNLNKRSITLNIECASGQELFRQLVQKADFLVECFRPGYLDKLGLGYPALSSINARLIHTSITPFGSTGPYNQFKGCDLVSMAESGLMYLVGDDDRPPVQFTTPVPSIQTGLEAAVATLAAHWYRQQSGEGQFVDVSAQESVMAQTLPQTMFWKTHGLLASRGNLGPRTPGRPSGLGIFNCQDGGLVICATTILRGRQPLRKWMDSEGMAGELLDPKWDGVFLKGATVTKEQKEYIDTLFRAFALKHTSRELMYEAQKRDIQVVKIQNVPDVIEDPHLKARDYFVQVEHPELGDTITYAGAPFKSDVMPWQYWRRAPFIGEHNEEIYGGELGLSRQDMSSLKEGGAI
ncbi:MAG: CoA transferase [Dehalococcoidales bacterium]|nr:CoA transferase [Dehalococcoidales bacterium]